MQVLPRLPQGHKVNIAWTNTAGHRLMGTCWTPQVRTFIDRRILPGATNIRLVCNGRAYDLGDN